MNAKISNIIINDLFGYYSYNIKEQNKAELDIAKLLILYGDNGCGKTTILKLIYEINCIGNLHRHGALTSISRTKFKNISIIYDDGFSVNLVRYNKNITGSFGLNICAANKIINEYIFGNEEILEKKASCNYDIKNNNELAGIIKFLRKRNTCIYYLSDKRKLRFSENGPNISESFIIPSQRRRRSNHISHIYDERELEVAVERENESEDRTLLTTLDEVTQMIRQESISSSIEGDKNTNSIYKDIIERISISGTSNSDTESNIDNSKKDILYQLEKISLESKSYSKYGLISEFEYNDYKVILNKCSEERKEIVNNVMKPYIDGLLARNSAIKDIYDILNTFVSNINEYFDNKKTISFNIHSGFKICYNNGEEIKPNYLSSGEKQLFLLFCNALLAGRTATIFLIDEPEISLNIKWQRKLINSLLELSKNNEIQYIIASHSMEILSSHRNNIGKLEM